MEDILELRSINKSFSGVQVLKNVSFSLRKGEIHGIMGENGAGKSTLMKIIGGVYIKDDGDIIFDGKTVHINAPKDAIELGVQIIHQEFNLVPKLTVAENIFLGDYPVTKYHAIDWPLMNQKANTLLERIGESIPAEELICNLSVAEQQIVEIAKAINRSPRVLIMDEPTAALNDQETEHLFKIVHRMREQGVSIIVITHRINEQLSLSDRITVLRDGSTVGTVDTKSITSDELVNMMVGRVIYDMFQRNRCTPGEPIFETKNLCVGNKVKNINIMVRKGEIVTIFGLMGMGQKYLCDAMVGSIKKTSGSIIVEGKTVNINSPEMSRKVGIGIVSDDRRKEGIIPVMSVNDNTSLSVLSRLSTKPFGFIKSKQENQEVLEWTKKLKVKCSGLKQQIRYLSGGNQQKVLIARWLINDTKLFILNMPTRGIDIGAKSEIYHLLDSLCKQGVAILLFSYEMPEVLGMSDRIYVICEGEISAEYSVEEATQEKLMQSAISKYII